MDAPDPSSTGIERAVRELTAAAKARRLYPASSPILVEAFGVATDALRERLDVGGPLALVVTRDGLLPRGTDAVAPVPAADVAGRLRDHGIAELTLSPGVTGEELATLLEALDAKPDDLAERGGVAGVLSSAGVHHIGTVAVTLVVGGGPDTGLEGETDAFLRELVLDGGKLSAWLSAVAPSDPQALAASLTDLAAATRGDESGTLGASLARAFAAQGPDARDGLLALAMDDSPVSGLLADTLADVSTKDLAASLAGGAFGRNMLSMSTALTRLPLGERFAEIMAQVEKMLPASGHGAKDIAFLEHMVAVRASEEPELGLVEAQPAYRKIAAIAALDASRVAAARGDILRSVDEADEAVVATLLRLLEQQDDFDVYCRTLDNLAGMVPTLIERGRVAQAARVLEALVSREARESQPWPELSERLRAAIGEATGRRSMKALVTAVSANRGLAPAARMIVLDGGDAAQSGFVEESLSAGPEGLAVAALVVGRRLADMLVAAAPRAQGKRLAALVAALARLDDANSRQAIELLLRRPDEISRREIVAGLAQAGGRAVVAPLARLLADPSFDVAVVAARALSGLGVPEAGTALASRLAMLDVDTKDFPLAREVIGALARCDDDAATAALTALTRRRSLVRRGHFAEVTALAKQALDQRGGEAR